MNEYREHRPCCDFHPKEAIIGVCPLCLNERLLILAEKQRHLSQAEGTCRSAHGVKHKKPPITLPKIFALSSLLNRFEFQNKKFHNSDHSDAPTSPEDSFISIKFEDNGVASWDKSTASKVSVDHCNFSLNHSLSKGTKSIVEHAKPHGSLRWRKRIGHLFQLTGWKRSSKGSSVCNVGSKLEGVKVRSGWIRALTKSRTKE